MNESHTDSRPDNNDAGLADEDVWEAGLFIEREPGYTLLDAGLEPISFGEHNGPRPYPSPWKASQRLQDARLLVVGGAVSDKRLLARSCAFEVAEMESGDRGPEDEVKAFEARTPTALLDFLDGDGKPTALVLTGVEPAWFHRHLPALRRSTDRHWLVLTTDRPREAWKLTDELEGCWHEPEESDLYLPGELTPYVVHRVDSNKLAGCSNLLGKPVGESCDFLARELGTPDAVDAFSRGLAAGIPSSRPELDALIARSRDNRQAVSGWFRYELDERERVAALALALLHGLDEDIGFAIIELLMDGVWRKRDAAIRFIDYGDLANVRQYFSLDNAERTGGTIFCRSEGARSAILHTAWDTHRRQLLAALPVLVEVGLAWTGRTGATSGPLLSRAQVDQLRTVAGETLGEVCLLSADAVEPSFLRLLASGKLAAHAVVARALRRVRRERGASFPLALVSRWRSSGALWEILGKLSGNASTENTGNLVGSAVVRIMAELAMEDPVDHVGDDLVGMLVGYASTPSGDVFDKFAHEALLEMARQHPGQLLGLIDRLRAGIGAERSRNGKFTSGLGVGLGLAINDGRLDVWQKLAGWVRSAYPHAGKGVDPMLVPEREQRLAIALHALSQVQSRRHHRSQEDEAPSPAAALGLVNLVLREERHPFVRAAAMRAVQLLIRREFERVADQLKETVSVVTREERRGLIDQLVDLHCLQRKRQGDGDSLIEVAGPLETYLCPVWHSKDPDNTPVLDCLFGWSASAGSPEVSSLASDAVRQIRVVIERSQERARSLMSARRAEEEQRQANIEKANAPKLDLHRAKLSFLQRHVAIPVATLGRPELRGSVAGILSSVIRLPRDGADEVIDRYRREANARGPGDPEGERLAAVAKAVRVALQVSRNLGAVVVILAALAGFIAYGWLAGQ